MIRIFTKVVLFLLNIYCLLNAQIYVSPVGDDITNPGTFDQPFQTVTKQYQFQWQAIPSMFV